MPISGTLWNIKNSENGGCSQSLSLRLENSSYLRLVGQNIQKFIAKKNAYTSHQCRQEDTYWGLINWIQFLQGGLIDRTYNAGF